MGYYTKGKLEGKVSALQILEFIKKNIDDTANMHIEERKYPVDGWDVKEHYGKDISHVTEVSGFINFHQKDGSVRNLFYCYIDVNTYENYDFYAKKGLADMVTAETTFIDLSYWGDSVKIIKSIVEHFGGWIDENDCDDKSYYHIFSNKEKEDIAFISKEEAETILSEYYKKKVVIVDKVV